MDIRKIQKIDELIQRQRTGSPAEFAARVGCSERMLYAYLKFMKEEMNAPINYSNHKHSYGYEENGALGLRVFEMGTN